MAFLGSEELMSKTDIKRYQGLLALPLGARTLLGAPGIATRLLGAPGTATRSILISIKKASRLDGTGEESMSPGSSTGLLSGNLGGSSVGALSARQER